MGEVYSFFLRDRAVFQKSATFNRLKTSRLVHVDARFKGENAIISKSDVDRQTDKLTTVTLSRIRAEG